jgi:hypothetical protein
LFSSAGIDARAEQPFTSLKKINDDDLHSFTRHAGHFRLHDYGLYGSHCAAASLYCQPDLPLSKFEAGRGDVEAVGGRREEVGESGVMLKRNPENPQKKRETFGGLFLT